MKSVVFSLPKTQFTMKLVQFVFALYFMTATGGDAFTIISPSRRTAAAATVRRAAGDYVPMEGEGKINLKVDLESPKVATMDEIEKGKKVYCRCWLSGTFPLCDGTHAKHNDATGDNVGPLIVSVKKE